MIKAISNVIKFVLQLTNFYVNVQFVICRYVKSDAYDRESETYYQTRTEKSVRSNHSTLLFH